MRATREMLELSVISDRSTEGASLGDDQASVPLTSETPLYQALERNRGLESICTALEMALTDYDEKLDALTARILSLKEAHAILQEKNEGLVDVASGVLEAACRMEAVREPLCSRLEVLSDSLKRLTVADLE